MMKTTTLSRQLTIPKFRAAQKSLIICLIAMAVGQIVADALGQETLQHQISDQESAADSIIITQPTPNSEPEPAVQPQTNSTAQPPSAVGFADFWKGIPVIHRPAKPGSYGIAPTGPGYYSLQDQLFGHFREAAPPTPYPAFGFMPPPYFDVNWSFLDDPTKSWSWSDRLKRQPLGNNWLATTGGSVWWRYMSERNARLSGVNQDYDLLRTRAYLDLSYLDRARVYFEYIDAQRFGGTLAPLPIDENRSDILNAFVDLQFLTINDHQWWARVGRQELTFGSQRLVSALDWANTRRTFEGVRMFRRSQDSDLDIWWSQPVIVDDGRLDRVDGNQHFVGAWLTKRPTENRVVDHYYLFLGNSAPRPQLGQPVPGFDTHTFGTRIHGNEGQFHYDYEGMLQLGSLGDQDIVAGAATVGHGYQFKDRPWNPMVWLYYDWASGDRNPGVGRHNTFHQQFPFGHYYLGFADIVGRQNIHDFNAHLIAYPRHWLTFITQYHNLSLASSRDALYNPAGNASRQDATGNSGRHIGHEIDFLANVHVNANADIIVGYSRLFAGRFIRETGAGDSPALFYLQYGYRW